MYTKSLESELAKTRLRETNLVRECEHLQSTVQSLLGRLSQLGLDTSPDLLYEGGNMVVSNPPQQGISPVPSSAIGTDDERHPTISHAVPPSASASASDSGSLLPSFVPLLPDKSRGTQLCNLDSATVGMEFVLTYVPGRFPIYERDSTYILIDHATGLNDLVSTTFTAIRLIPTNRPATHLPRRLSYYFYLHPFHQRHPAPRPMRILPRPFSIAYYLSLQKSARRES